VPDIQSKLSAMLRPTDLEERCGFVTKRGRVVEVRNIAPDPVAGFVMDPTESAPIMDKDPQATWHTHPGGDPNLSGEDYAAFLAWPELTHYIVGVVDRTVWVKTYIVQEGLVVQS